MNYAEIKYNDIANGEGVRTSLFVSGCRHGCPNCFNKIAWRFDYGKKFDKKVREKVLKSVEPYWINGLSLLGGEPLEPDNQPAILSLLKEFRRRYPDKNVWCYTGFTYEQLMGMEKSRSNTDIAKEILKYIDILVDGQYIEELYDIRLKFRGSSNQRVIDMKKTLEQNKIVLYLE